MNIFDSTFISVANKTNMYMANVTGAGTGDSSSGDDSKLPSAINDVADYFKGEKAIGNELDGLKSKGFSIGVQIAMIAIGLVFISIVVFMVLNAGRYGGSNSQKVQEGKDGLGRGTIAMLIVAGVIGVALFIAGIGSAIFS